MRLKLKKWFQNVKKMKKAQNLNSEEGVKLVIQSMNVKLDRFDKAL
jgi:hypothetical protein